PLRGEGRADIPGALRARVERRRGPPLPPAAVPRPRAGAAPAGDAPVPGRRPPRAGPRRPVRRPDRQPRVLVVHDPRAPRLLRARGAARPLARGPVAPRDPGAGAGLA